MRKELIKRLCIINKQLAIIEDKLRDNYHISYRSYISDLRNSRYDIEDLLDQKIELQQIKNGLIYKLKHL